MLQGKDRIRLSENIGNWRRVLLEQGVVEIQVDGSISLRAASLADFHTDRADRVIVAAALNGHCLVTADKRILDWPGELERLDASEQFPRTSC